jgi:serine/threonine-protein kinase
MTAGVEPTTMQRTLDHFELVSRLATGGMSEVWLARDLRSANDSKHVVLKTMLPHIADDPDLARMFRTEAEIANELAHPNIVRVFDHGFGNMGDASLGSQNRYWIAMEYVAGRTLRQVLSEMRRRRRLVPQWFVLRVGQLVCDALTYAHAMVCSDGRPANLVHRDISPENIMIDFDGIVKVLDFGIAHVSFASRTSGVSSLKGKAAYMSPEQIREPSALGPPADIYSLGVVLYELLSGRRPFQAPNEVAMIHSILQEQPEPLQALMPNLPARLTQIVMRCLEKDPAHRYALASDLRAALDGFIDDPKLAASNEMVASYLGGLFGRSQSDSPPIHRVSTPAPASGPQDLSSWDRDLLAALDAMPMSLANPAGCEPITAWDRAVAEVRKEAEIPKNELLPAPSAPAPRTAAEWVEVGHQMLRNKDLQGALKAWEHANALEPDNRSIAANIKRLRNRIDSDL